jgi:hypothetical protein
MWFTYCPTFLRRVRLQIAGQIETCSNNGTDDKRGSISANSAKLLTRLHIPQDNWLKLTTEFGKLFQGPVGTLQELTRYCEHLEKRRRHFASCCQHLKAG